MIRQLLVATAAVSAFVLAPSSEADERTKIDRCPSQPDILKTAVGAKHRASKGWNARTLDKDRGAIERVRIQSRCAPTQEGRKYVKDAIDHAQRKYQAAKHKAEVAALFAKLTESPGLDRLARLASCESGNRYHDPDAPAGAFGMLQGWSGSYGYYMDSGWPQLTGDDPVSPPYLASRKQQQIRASLLYVHGGSWSCPF